MSDMEKYKEFKERLEKTLTDIEAELQEYESKEGEIKPKELGSDVEGEDWAEEADEAEEIVTDIGISAGLKERRDNILRALEKMKKGDYGKCEAGPEDIESEILTIDPESRFCKEHKKGK